MIPTISFETLATLLIGSFGFGFAVAIVLVMYFGRKRK